MNQSYSDAEAGRRGTTAHPVSDVAIRDAWPAFTSVVRDRLEVGAHAYGDSSFDMPAGKLALEIEQEMLDVMGWGFILWCRMQTLKAKLERFEGSILT